MGKTTAAWIALACLGAAACRTAGPFGEERRESLAAGIVETWAPASRETAGRLLERYGPPDAFAANALAWRDKGPWKRIVLLNADADYVRRLGSGDDLRQTVSYRLSASRRAALEAFSDKVSASADGAELSALSDDERLNFLSLNLADAVARGALTPVDAQREYVKAVELAASGKSSEAMTRLLFAPAR